MTRQQLKARIARVEREYRAASDEIDRLPPGGNGFATREEMRKTVAEVYLGTLAALRRKLERSRP